MIPDTNYEITEEFKQNPQAFIYKGEGSLEGRQVKYAEKVDGLTQ